MVAVVAAGLTLATAALAFAYAREVRLRRALERLLTRILTHWRRHDPDAAAAPCAGSRDRADGPVDDADRL